MLFGIFVVCVLSKVCQSDAASPLMLSINDTPVCQIFSRSTVFVKPDICRVRSPPISPLVPPGLHVYMLIMPGLRLVIISLQQKIAQNFVKDSLELSEGKAYKMVVPNNQMLQNATVLKPLAGGPGLPSLKCTRAAAQVYTTANGSLWSLGLQLINTIKIKP